jgi:signal transduction histidine kinase
VADRSDVDYAAMFAAMPIPCLVLAPDLVILDATESYLSATGRRRAELVGTHLFTAFPDNPSDPHADGVRNLRASLERVLDSGQADAMALQRYDLPAPATGEFVARWWSPVNVPLLGDDGTVRLVLHRVEDVTEFVRERGLAEDKRPGRRLQDEAELFVRARELQALNARLRRVGERERQRWALELHDETLQGLGAVRGLLSTARRHGSEDALRTAVDVALDVLADEIGKLRHLIIELRPAELDELGLQAALEELARRAGAVDGFDVHLDIELEFEKKDEPERLVPDLEVTIYRVLQEALTNVARHADATHVNVRVIE